MRNKRLSVSQLLVSVLVISFLTAGCSGEAGESAADNGLSILESVPEFTLNEAFRISEFGDNSSYFFASVSDVVADPNGVIFASDIRAVALHQFGADGNYTGLVGREGSGPGEYQSIGSIAISEDGTLFVNDWRQLRIVSYNDTNGTRRHARTETMGLPDRGSFNGIEEFFYLRKLHDTQEGLIAEFQSSVSYDGGDTIWSCFARLNGDFTIDDSSDPLCFEMVQSMVSRSSSGNSISVSMMSVPENHRSLLTVTSGGSIIKLHTSQKNVSVYNPDGIVSNEFSFPAVKVSISPQMKQQLVQESIPNPQNSDFRTSELSDAIPEHKGYAEQLITDDENRIWILSRTGEEELTWLVYTHDGDLLARTEHPGGDFTHISNGRAYAAFNPGDDDPSFAVYSFSF
ncbi:MAG: 6-bladed beta-propeller [Balneolia bacterium]|nr:6-bladed beta-propeller [Balneolia bacterium]